MKPRTKLQQKVQQEYLHGRYLYAELRPISPKQIEIEHKMSWQTIKKVHRGHVPRSTNSRRSEEELKVIRDKCDRYLKLFAEWQNYTTDEIAKRYGITKSTVFRYGKGDFGGRNSPNMPVEVDQSLLASDAVERFLTMKLSQNPATCRQYY